MRNIGVIVVGLGCLLGGNAMAAGLGGPPSPGFTWTGLYVGADAGYEWSQGTLYASYNDNTGRAAENGATVGAHIGYLFQLPTKLFPVKCC